MAHESFEDPATAELMNRLFVNIKVDREERPDLDKIYQTAHQLLARRAGGWPLTVFLTRTSISPSSPGPISPGSRAMDCRLHPAPGGGGARLPRAEGGHRRPDPAT